MVLAATAGMPYMFSHSDHAATSATAGSGHYAEHQELDGLTHPTNPSNLPIEGVGIQHVSQVFRFDVSMQWVISTWPRVTTGLADLQVQGYRVPLVTGTRPTDVAGALTYYFNPQQQVQRILFHGSTGDPADLVNFLTQRYGFERITVSDPGMHLYQRKEGLGKITGEARIRSLGVVRQDTPLNRWDVSLIMDRPGE